MAAEDKLLARRLARDARVAGKAQARAAKVHASALARRERVLRRSRRALPVRVAVTGVAVVAAVTTEFGLLWGVAAFAGVRAGVAARHLLRPPPLPPTPTGPAGPPPPPPEPRSAAFPAVRRLEQARVSLQRLIPLVAPSGRDAAGDAWRAAAEADLALRWQAARLAAVEPYGGADEHLLGQLYAGVVAQEGLVVAVADLVAASADPLAERLQDVTDRLVGLAQGMREVRQPRF